MVGGIGIIALLRMGASMDACIALGADLRNYAQQADAAVLQATNDENAFVKAANPASVDAFKKDVEQVIQNAQAIKKALPPTDALQPMQDQVIKLVGEYEQGFLSVVTDVNTRGKTDTGLEGDFRNKAHDVEAAVLALKQVVLERDYLEIRRHEKDYLLRGDDTYVAQVADSITTFKSHLATAAVSAAAKTNMATLWDRFADLFSQHVAIDKRITSETAAYTPKSDRVRTFMAQSVADVTKDATAQHTAAEATKSTTLVLVVGVVLGTVFAALLLGLILSTNIARPLIKMVGVAQKMADGDLSLDVRVKSRDEVGELAQTFNHMSGKLNAMMRQILESSSHLASSSEEIAASAEQLASGSQNQASTLEETSASSTKEIGVLIGDSGKSVATGVKIAEATLKAMNMIIKGSKKTGEMIESLSGDLQQGLTGIKEVSKAVESISEMSQSISAATEQQSTNSKQVSKAIENVNELTQQAASAAEKMSAATVELSELASKMRGLVEQFNLGQNSGAIGAAAGGTGSGKGESRQLDSAFAEQISAAINAHGQWLFHQQDAIRLGKSDFDPAKVKTDNNCAFGKWVHRDLATRLEGMQLSAEIKDFRARFHQEAGKILEMALRGDKAEAGPGNGRTVERIPETVGAMEH